MMMNSDEQALSLHRPAAYQIKVPGHLDHVWAEWAAGMEIAFEGEEGGMPVTILTCEVDQAGLQGLLRRLYSLGLPLISVLWVG
jgi:hypothetical protein